MQADSAIVAARTSKPRPARAANDKRNIIVGNPLLVASDMLQKNDRTVNAMPAYHGNALAPCRLLN